MTRRTQSLVPSFLVPDATEKDKRIIELELTLAHVTLALHSLGKELARDGQNSDTVRIVRLALKRSREVLKS